jgi:hypothetical protein
MQPFPGVKHFTTHHCVSGSLRHIYEFNGYPISEEMLLGLGAGVGFIYWHTKGTLPFLGGRANLERPGVEGFEKAIGRRTGVKVENFHTSSAAKAEKTLLDMLLAGQPVMLVLDMGFLPYFDFGGQEYHFGYHVVVACGYDPQARLVLLADRDEALHPVSLETLAKARGSKYKPFPPKHAWYKFDFGGKRPPEPGEIWQAVRECAVAMLQPPIANFGVKGIYKAARRIQDWPNLLNEEDLRATCTNTAIMIDARGGTGGGLFRYMYARFLNEVAGLTGERQLVEIGKDMQAIGDQWQAAAGLFERAAGAHQPASLLGEVCDLLPQIATQEQLAWQGLMALSEAQVANVQV